MAWAIWIQSGSFNISSDIQNHPPSKVAFPKYNKHLSWRVTQYHISTRAVPNVPSRVCSRKWSMLHYTWFGGSKPPTFYAFHSAPDQSSFSPLLGPLHWALIWSPLESIWGGKIDLCLQTGTLFELFLWTYYIQDLLEYIGSKLALMY